MLTLKYTGRRLLLVAVLATAPVVAQDSGALIDALIRKGILTNQEAEDIRADLVRESNVIPAHAVGGGKATDRLSVGMKMQTQYAGLRTDVRGAAFNAPATDHFFLRRMYLTLKAGVGGNWGATFTADFAGGSYDDAILEWKPSHDLSFNFGLRKVNVAYEERASSGNIKAIERSSVTRYFVESNNGRRLGAASYRIGAFVDGKREVNPNVNFVYSAAVTSPERNETFTGAAFSGDSSTNRSALWGNVGLAGKLPNNGSWIAGVGAGWLPDQGGFGTANLGRGSDLTLYSVYTDINVGRFGLMAEYLAADVDHGAATGRDALPWGFYLQPSFMITENLEAVVRYAFLDTDHRGVNLSDAVRSAPSGGIMNELTEGYVGGNYYLRGNDLKIQLGMVYGKTRDGVSGAPAQAKTIGVRSQMQMQF
jgi:hypothetical protein